MYLKGILIKVLKKKMYVIINLIYQYNTGFTASSLLLQGGGGLEDRLSPNVGDHPSNDCRC